MSDFFRQLVARHQGHAGLVQPLLPNRFGGWVDEPAAPKPPWAEVVAETVAAPGPVVTAPNLAGIEAVVPPASRVVPLNPGILPASRSVTPTSRLETVTQWIHQVEQVSTVTNVSNVGAMPSLDGPPPPVQIPPVVPPALQSPAIASSPLPVQDFPVERPARSLVPEPISPDGPAPVPAPTLLPDPPSLAAIPIAPAPSAPPPLLPPTPLPIIRVTIGRVEIRANPAVPVAPPAPRRTPPSQRPALSLDAYLHQRSRRS